MCTGVWSIGPNGSSGSRKLPSKRVSETWASTSHGPRSIRNGTATSRSSQEIPRRGDGTPPESGIPVSESFARTSTPKLAPGESVQRARAVASWPS